MKFEKLGNIAKIQIGKTPKRAELEYWGKGYPWVSISDMKSEVIENTKEEITEKAIKECNCKIIPRGTLLMSFKLSVGKLAFAGTDLYTNEAICGILINDSKKIDSKYFYYALKNTKFLGSNTAVMGTTLNTESLNNLQIPFIDSVTEQKHIAEVLSKAEALIAERKQSIQLLDEYLKSTFLEMFGDPVKNEKGWEKVKLSKLGTLDRGVSKHRPRNAPELLGGEYPLIQTGDIANAGLYIEKFNNSYSELGLKQSKLWPINTLCITIAANIGKTSILKFPACFPDSVVGFVVNEKEANNIYVYFLFGSLQSILEKNAPQAAQKNINLDVLRNLEVPKPDIKLQAHFASIVEKTEALKAQYKEHLQSLEQMYGALSQRAFRGEIIKLKLPKHTQRV